MLVREVLESAAGIPDPYVRSVTYARIGEKLALKGHPLYKEAFLRAFEALSYVESPFLVMKGLLSIGVSMGRARLKAYRKVFYRILAESEALSVSERDEILKMASLALLSLGDIGEAISFALEITENKTKNEVLVSIVRSISRSLEVNPIKKAYRLRKIRLALEYINEEPFRSKALLELSKALVSLGSYEGAFSAIREMGSREWARQAFKELAFRLSELGIIKKYLESFKILTDELSERFGENFTIELATAFALAGEPALAIELLRPLGLEVIEKIALDVLEKNPDVLPSLLNVLSSSEAMVVGKALMNRLLDSPSPEKLEIVNAIARIVRSEEVWAKVARFYTLIGDVESARKLGLAIQSSRLRSLVMADVAHHYLKTGNVEKAIDVALEVRDKRFASLLMSEILIKALSKELEGREHGKIKSPDREKRKSH